MQLLPREARSATPTEVESEGDGFVIRRRYDVDLQALAPVAHDYFIEAPSHVGLVLPSSRSVSSWEWRSPHGTTLAALLAPPNFSMGATFTTAFGEIGASLRTLHEVPRQGIEVPAELVRRPTSLLRTSAWVDRTWGNARAKAALEQLEARLSPLEWHAVQDAVHGVQASFVGDVAVVQGWVVSLGGLSLANVLTTPGDPRFGWAILSGPDNCLGPAEYDIGFVLGELAEHAFVCAAAGVPGDDFAQLAASFLSGYGTVLDPALVAAVTVFRVLLHILDFSHFVGEIDDWYMYAELMRVLVDSPLGWIPGL